tara:strand:+ start:243 stop:416 length:174 start_codon:yes stop_codon:yes gene_type:complete
MEKLFRIVLVGLALYCVLYWAANNPKSVARLKATVDNVASDTVDKAKEIANNLTDEE